MKKLGIEPGKPFNIATVDPIIARALDTVPEDGQKLMDWKCRRWRASPTAGR